MVRRWKYGGEVIASPPTRGEVASAKIEPETKFYMEA